MTKTTQKRRSPAGKRAGAPRKPAARPAGPQPVEAERDALLRVIPDQVFRIRMKPDGAVSVTDFQAGPQPDGGNALEGAGLPPAGDLLMDEAHGLRSALALRAGGLLESFRQSGQVQALEIGVGQEGRVRHYEVRAAGCARRGLPAVVQDGQTSLLEIGAPAGEADDLVVLARDITSRREAQASITRSQDEIARLNQAMKNEASEHEEDEELMNSAFGKLSRLLEDTIGVLQMIVQTKDPLTAQHQARVCKLACAIGREMGLDKTRVDTIGLAALLHDLGKVLVPDDMLNKPGPLSDTELATIRESAETEYRILKAIDLFCPIADIVHQHHERMDGSGYPLGLKDEDILLEARVIAVADVVEAMLSERPHRPALGVEAALREVQGNRGSLYDAGAVDACCRLFSDGSFRFAAPAESPPRENACSGS